MQALVAGDPNNNRVYGAEEYGYLEVTAGDPYASYLFLALLGEVGPVPMPLANKSLNDEELVAIACWIEGLTAPGGDQPDAEIDYVNCEYAQSKWCD
jgi:hypothetical protein